MKLLKNKELNRDKWISLLRKSEFSTPLQSPEFYDLFNSVEDYSADVLAIEKDGEYKSLIIVTIQKEKGVKSFFSRRGIVYAGPLLIDSNQFILEFLLKEVNAFYKRKLIYLEVRNQKDYSSFMYIFNDYGWKHEEHLNVELTLENLDAESVLSGMKYNRRREIRLSYKENAIARPAKDEKEVNKVYDILKEMYRTRVKLPLFCYPFFLELYRSKIGKVFVVLHEDKIIGGSFCLYYDNMTMNTFYYTGLRNYHKKIFPTHLAVMSIIKFSIDNNLKMVDFMGAGKPNVDYGVRDYKLQFGGDLVNYGRFKIIYKPFMFNLGVWALKVLTKLK
jgi:lipid II:glycine glycyltransferase (peptidoglycan interpeptide bridge formation enzyme)